MTAKSSRFVRYTRSMTTSSNVAPAASTIARTFSSVRVVCAATSPGWRYSFVAGSTGPCPDTWTNGPLRTPWWNVCAGAGASGVETAVFSVLMGSFRDVGDCGGGGAAVPGAGQKSVVTRSTTSSPRTTAATCQRSSVVHGWDTPNPTTSPGRTRAVAGASGDGSRAR